MGNNTFKNPKWWVSPLMFLVAATIIYVCYLIKNI